MKTRMLGFAVLLVAFAVIMNAMALSSATVTNAMSVDIVNTTTALIALDAADVQDGDVIVDTSTGKLSVTVSDGVQPDSSYTFSQVFKITNNSSGSVNVTVSASAHPGMTLTMLNAADDAELTNVALGSGLSINVKMTVATASGSALVSTPFDVTVSAVKP